MPEGPNYDTRHGGERPDDAFPAFATITGHRIMFHGRSGSRPGSLSNDAISMGATIAAGMDEDDEICKRLISPRFLSPRKIIIPASGSKDHL